MAARKFLSRNPVDNSIIQSFNLFNNAEINDTIKRSS